MNARAALSCWITIVTLVPAAVRAEGGVATEDDAGTAMDVSSEAVSEVRAAPQLHTSAELELMAGFQRLPFDRLALPLRTYLLAEATTPRRESGAMALVTLGADPFGPEGEASLRGLDIYHNGMFDRLDLHLGRLNLVRGGRYRYVDGADLRLRLVDHLYLAAWGGAAWHPELTGLFDGGPTWGADLSYRSASMLGGGVRYDHIAGDDGRGVDRLGGDVSLHVPRASGLVAEARVDVVPAHGVVELLGIATELRPHHRVHLRIEGGATNPVVDVIPYGGSVYDALLDGPTVYLDGRVRVGLQPGMLTLDAGALGLTGGDRLLPGFRLAVGGSSHPGRRWRHVVRGSVLAGPGGTAAVGLAEVGRRFGILDASILAEQAVYRYDERPWRAATHLGAQLALGHSGAPARVSLTAQLDVGRNTTPEGQLLLVGTFRLEHGRGRALVPVRDRYISPYSPYRWERDHMPRSPGTVPGADPYPSVPQGRDDDGE